jgi:hypothetical protein
MIIFVFKGLDGQVSSVILYGVIDIVMYSTLVTAANAWPHVMHLAPNQTYFMTICISGFPELRNESCVLRFKFVPSVKCF